MKKSLELKPETDTSDLFDLSLFRLDQHWLEQPAMVADYGRQHADARDEMDRAKANLDVTRAEALKDISANPDEHGIVKTTDKAVAAAVDAHEEVVAAQEILRRKSHHLNLTQAVLNALEHRKKALENLVLLHGRDYFSEPQADRKGHESLEDRRKQRVRHPKSRD